MFRSIVAVVLMAALTVAATAPTVDAVWRFKIQSITWDTTTNAQGYKEGGSGVVVGIKTWDAAKTPADTFAFNMGLPLTFTVDTMRVRIEQACLRVSQAVKRADSLTTTYVGATANVPGTN